MPLVPLGSLPSLRSPGMTDVVERSPGMTDVVERSPGMTDVVERSLGMTDVVERSPGMTDVVVRSPIPNPKLFLLSIVLVIKELINCLKIVN